MQRRLVKGAAAFALFTTTAHCFYSVGALEQGSPDDPKPPDAKATDGDAGPCGASCDGEAVPDVGASDADAGLDAGPLPPTQGLVLYLPFNGDPNDKSPRQAACTVRNGAALAVDRRGASASAYSFDGVDDSIDCETTLPTGDAPRSLSVWFAAKVGLNDEWNAIANWGANEQGERFGVSLREGKVAFTGQGSEYDLHSTKSGNDGAWHHAVVVYQAKTLTIYVDNKLEVSSTIDLDTSPGNPHVGRKVVQPAGNAESFVGAIDDVRVYDRVLTPAEVAALYSEK